MLSYNVGFVCRNLCLWKRIVVLLKFLVSRRFVLLKLVLIFLRFLLNFFW